MDQQTVARSMRGSIGMLAMAWLNDPATFDLAARRGVADPLGSYAIGRFGVLGDVPPDNVVGAAFFWQPDHLRGLVAKGLDDATAAEGAAIYVDACREWGAAHLGSFSSVVRLGELCEAVVASASPLGAPLFVGWRDQPLPPVGPERTMQLCQVMRELRFSRHCVAVQADGMSPLEAILSGPAGDWNAKFFGWPEPYPDVSGLDERRAAIEDHTDRLHAPDFDVLSATDRQELRDLAKAARAHVSGD